jgi:hypothetical protein
VNVFVRRGSSWRGAAVDVAVTVGTDDAVAVEDDVTVGGARHSLYSTALHRPTCSSPATQQSQQIEGAGHVLQLKFACACERTQAVAHNNSASVPKLRLGCRRRCWRPGSALAIRAAKQRPAQATN